MGLPHLWAAQDSGQRDIVPLDGTFSHSRHRGPAGHVQSTGQPVQLTALQGGRRGQWWGGTEENQWTERGWKWGGGGSQTGELICQTLSVISSSAAAYQNWTWRSSHHYLLDSLMNYVTNKMSQNIDYNKDQWRKKFSGPYCSKSNEATLWKYSSTSKSK